jgi:hypothetical protein
MYMKIGFGSTGIEAYYIPFFLNSYQIDSEKLATKLLVDAYTDAPGKEEWPRMEAIFTRPSPAFAFFKKA